MHADDHHVTRQLLDAVERGEIDRGQLEHLLVRHLQHACETCRREIAAWQSSRLPLRRPGAPLGVFLRERVADPAEETKAEEQLGELLALEPDEQRRRVRRATRRFRSPRLGHLLLDEALESLASDPDEAEQIVATALEVLNKARDSAAADEALARAHGMRAMVYKAQGNLAAAERQLGFVRSFQHERGVSDLAVCAELDEIEGSFRKDRCQLDRSEGLLVRGISLYEVVGDLAAAARARIVLAGTLFYQGRSRRAVRVIEEALPHLDRARHPGQCLMAVHNIALYLCEAGRASEAAARFKANMPLYEQLRPTWPHLDPHVHWLAGKIQRRLDRLENAEKHLVRARQGFARSRATQYDAIAVCLDLSLVYMAQHRYDELTELAELMITGFAAEGVHQEALAAVSLAAEAARKRRLTEELAREVAHFLQFARHDPSLKLRG